MKTAVFSVIFMLTIPICATETAAEAYDRTNRWYGVEANYDEVWESIQASMMPPSNVIMEVRAFQATNRIPVLAEVMASNRVYAISKGLDPRVITWSEAESRSLNTPPLPEDGEIRPHQDARHLMALMGVPDGDATVTCNNWVMPTNIYVNGQSYSVKTNCFESVSVALSTDALNEVARGQLLRFTNGKEARIGGFMQRETSLGTVNEALNLSVMNLDPATNMMFLCSKDGRPSRRDVLIYKNLVLRLYAPTNAPLFAATIINEGLPEEERIPLPPAP